MALAVTMTSRSIELIFFDAGGGHRAAAEALKQVLADKHPDWQVKTVDLQEVLKSADPLFILTGVPSQNFYNAALKVGLTYGSRGFLRGLQTIIKICAPRMEEVLRHYWSAETGAPLNAVISLIPNFNAVMFRALRAARPAVPFVTIMTDMADSPPHFWQEKQDQHIICGTAYAAMQARATGWYRPERIFETSGMIVRPSFYQQPPAPRLTREMLGLAHDKPTALITFGGYGSSLSEDIVDRLNKAKLGVQTIVLCGRNEKLRADLQGKKGCSAVGFTSDVADYMRLCDFFIGKPGPGSLSEAWLMGLPVIVERNARTMIQERPNTLLVKTLGTGISITSFRTIAKTVRTLITSGQLDKMRKNVQQLNNQAIFEIPNILDFIMSQPYPGSRPAGLKAPRKLTRMAKKWGRKRQKKKAID